MSSLDKQEYKKRVWSKLMTNPLTLIPLLGGSTMLLLTWAMDAKAGAALFAGVAGMVVGVGHFLTQLFTRAEVIQKQVMEEMQHESEQEREAVLDAFSRELELDRDPRTEASLRELRALITAFKKEDLWSKAIDSNSTFDIVSGIDRLFDTCVDYLRKTLQLWHTAQEMATDDVRAPMLERREKLIQDVRESTRHISLILAKAQTIGLGESMGTDLDGIRNDLDASLDVAKRVQERIADWRMPGMNLQDT